LKSSFFRSFFASPWFKRIRDRLFGARGDRDPAADKAGPRAFAWVRRAERKVAAEGGDLTETAKTGLWGEEIAARMLVEKGYSILGRRVLVGRRDELDIVALRGRDLVFVEVKTRSGEAFGRPSSAVDRRKRHALCRAAATFLRRSRYPDLFYRFDIVEVVGRRGASSPPVVRHLEDAFRFPVQWHFPVRRKRGRAEAKTPRTQ
jgi:putative endonuclease